MNKHQYNSESGNILFFILIGIVLIGLVTVVISRSSSSVDQSGDVEQWRILAGQILRTAKGYEAAIQQMKLRGISESDISFENIDTAIDYTNSNCTASDCLVFDAEGAGLTYTAPPERGQTSASEWIFTGANNVGTTTNPSGTTAAGSGNDLLMIMPNVIETLCIQINRILEVNEPNNTPPIDDQIDLSEFAGTYQSGTLYVLEGDTTNQELNGHNSGCFYDTASSGYYFYHILLER